VTLPTDKLFKILYKLADSGIYSVFLTGGEPLIRRDIAHIVSYCVRLGMNVTLSTNGTLLDSALAENLYSAGLDEIQISLQSSNPKRQDEIVGLPNAFFRAEIGLQNAQAAGIRVIVACVGTKNNYIDIPKLAEWAIEKKGVKAFRVLRLIPNSYTSLHQVLSHRELNFIIEGISEKGLDKKAIIDVHAPPFYIPPIKTSPIKYAHYPHYPMLASAMTSTCTAGRMTMAILADGQTTPCIEFREREFLCGNILEKELQEIWNHPNMRKLREATPDKYEGKTCSKCLFKWVCYSARCIAYRFGGGLLGDDITCLKNEEVQNSGGQLKYESC
jgi:radical SAM protein with 4Fe4S-binding SPASM domain